MEGQGINTQPEIQILNVIYYKGSAVKIIITKTIGKSPQKDFVISDDKFLYVGIGSAFIFVTLVLISCIILYKKKQEIKRSAHL